MTGLGLFAAQAEMLQIKECQWNESVFIHWQGIGFIPVQEGGECINGKDPGGALVIHIGRSTLMKNQSDHPIYLEGSAGGEV